MVNQRIVLEGELSQVESTIEKLFQRRLQLKHEINQCCPIFKLHPEILLQIFMATLPENPFPSRGSTTPLLLGAVCHVWRELAWSSPLLWSNVSLTVKHYTETKNDLLQEWLARSSDLPLSIGLNMCEPIKLDWKEQQVVWKSMDIIARCSERWQNVDLRLLAIFHPRICFVPTHFPLLISISIYYESTNIYAELLEQMDDFRVSWNAPNLQHIHLDEIMETHLAFPLGGVITLSRCGNSTPHRLLEILHDAPNLVQCKFNNINDRFRRDPSKLPPMVTTLQLKKLDIRCNYVSQLAIFNVLTIPAVSELFIDSRGPFPYTDFISLVSRSGCHLMRLSLSGITFSGSQLAECLQATPSLTELQLNIAAANEIMPNIVTMNKALTILTIYQNSQKALLPNLRSFVCIYNNGILAERLPDPDLSALAVMGRSRWDHSSRISTSFEVAQLKSIYVEIRYISYPMRKEECNEDEESDGSNRDAANFKICGADIRQKSIGPILSVDAHHVTAKFGELITEGMNISIQSMIVPPPWLHK